MKNKSDESSPYCTPLNRDQAITLYNRVCGAKSHAEQHSAFSNALIATTCSTSGTAAIPEDIISAIQAAISQH